MGGEDDREIAEYDRFLRTANPLDVRTAAAYRNRGLAWQRKGRYDKAVADFNQAVATDPIGAESYKYRGLAWCHMGQFDKAVADFSVVIRLRPKSADAYCDRGNALDKAADSGDAASRQDGYKKAIADYTEAIRLEPRRVTAYWARGAVWDQLAEYDKAIADYSDAIRLDLRYAAAYLSRGVARAKKGEYDKALADYDQAVRINPYYAESYHQLAWLYATCPDQKYRDGKKAFDSASMAYQLRRGKDWQDVDTLAAAYAAYGDFRAARQWQSKAVEMAATVKSATEKEKAEMRSRLELYKQGKPYREEPKNK